MPGTWPLPSDYIAAFEALRENCEDADLRQGALRRTALGMPQCAAGESSVVFRVDRPDTGRNWAVKCYTVERPGLRSRYAALRSHFASGLPSYLENFEWLEHGIRVGERWYPVLKMPWLQGEPLGEFLLARIGQASLIRRFADLWMKLAERMDAAGIAHGDLQPANVLLTESQPGRFGLKLIDYDSLYIPALKTTPPDEWGHPAFQHPNLSLERDYGPGIDRFPHLVIYASLRCLAIGGQSLWDACGDPDRLLFSARDLEAPERSPTFKCLWSLPDAEVHSLVGRLMLTVRGTPDEIPRLADLQKDDGLRQLTALQGRVIEQAFQAGAWPSEYDAEINVNRPAAILLLVQQSAPDYARWANRVIEGIAFRCSAGSGLRNWFHLGVARYGNGVLPGWGDPLRKDNHVPIGELAQQPLRIEKEVIPGQGESQERRIMRPVWIDSNLTEDAESSFCEALRYARQWASEFLERFPDSYPPLVLHFGDGRSKDGDPEHEAVALRQTASTNGTVLLFNGCLDPTVTQPLLFPETDRGLGDAARLLWRLSSPLPASMREAARLREECTGENARGFSCNTGLEVVTQLFQLGTRVGVNSGLRKPAAQDRKPAPFVFISAKSEDYPHAQNYYRYLTERGLRVFLSCESLPELGISDYREAIDQALDQANHMLVVTSSAENVLSSWVKAEWGLFINEKRSDRKQGNLVTVAVGALQIRDLPASLRYYEVIADGPQAFDKVLNYLTR